MKIKSRTVFVNPPMIEVINEKGGLPATAYNDWLRSVDLFVIKKNPKILKYRDASTRISPLQPVNKQAIRKQVNAIVTTTQIICNNALIAENKPLDYSILT